MLDLTGQKFGKLTAIRPLSKRTEYRNVIWLCECDCGNRVEVPCNYLRQLRTKSCGCLVGKEKHHGGVLLSHLCATNARKDNTTGFRGVTAMRNKFQARIYLAGEKHHLGTFSTAEAAYAAYLKAKKKLHLPLLQKYNYSLGGTHG